MFFFYRGAFELAEVGEFFPLPFVGGADEVFDGRLGSGKWVELEELWSGPHAFAFSGCSSYRGNLGGGDGWCFVPPAAADVGEDGGEETDEIVGETPGAATGPRPCRFPEPVLEREWQMTALADAWRGLHASGKYGGLGT